MLNPREPATTSLLGYRCIKAVPNHTHTGEEGGGTCHTLPSIFQVNNMDEDCFVVSHTRPTDFSGHKFTVDFDLSQQGNAHCSICTSECGSGGESRVRLECNHSFHKECIERWFRFHEESSNAAPSCPNCRFRPSNNTDNTDNTNTDNTDNTDNTNETDGTETEADPIVSIVLDNNFVLVNQGLELEFQRVIRRMNEYFMGETSSQPERESDN